MLLRLSLVVAERGLLSGHGVGASHWGDFSCCRALALGHMGSVVVAYSLSCPVACRILVPRPGIEPMPPALEVWILNHWITREVPLDAEREVGIRWKL